MVETADGPVIVYFTRDEDGEIRSLSVPMIKS